MAFNEEVKSDLSATKKALSPKQKKTIILLSVVGVLFLAIVGIFVSMAINKAVRGNCIIEKAINAELIFDWMIYRDFEGRGIYALINEKMDGLTLDEYNAGGCPIYEFARFQRKYHTYKKAKELKSKESAQEAFRNAVAQQVATQITAQQLLEGKDPMEFVNMLFGKPDFENSIKEITGGVGNNKSKTPQITYKKNKKH